MNINIFDKTLKIHMYILSMLICFFLLFIHNFIENILRVENFLYGRKLRIRNIGTCIFRIKSFV